MSKGRGQACRGTSMPEKGYSSTEVTLLCSCLCSHHDMSTQGTTPLAVMKGLANLGPGGGLMTVCMRSSLESHSSVTSDFQASTETQPIIPSGLCPVIMGILHFWRRRDIKLRAVGMANHRWRLILVDHMMSLCHDSLPSSSLDSDSCIVKNFLNCIKSGHCRQQK